MQSSSQYIYQEFSASIQYYDHFQCIETFLNKKILHKTP